MTEKKIIKNQKRNFVDDCLKDLDFTGWLVKVKEDKTKACSGSFRRFSMRVRQNACTNSVRCAMVYDEYFSFSKIL